MEATRKENIDLRARIASSMQSSSSGSIGGGVPARDVDRMVDEKVEAFKLQEREAVARLKADHRREVERLRQQIVDLDETVRSRDSVNEVITQQLEDCQRLMQQWQDDYNEDEAGDDYKDNGKIKDKD